ncbi:MAG: rod shape-determining protein RodA [Candidatus Margulisbacteria bacterium]|nr:rod shape-determining protein RodA [Candidatus Margulisiibacteriota bacterium]
MLNLRMLKVSDLLLWIAVGLLALIGFFAIFSSTFALLLKHGIDSLLYVKRQMLAFSLGAAGLVFFSYLDYKHLKRLAPFLYALMLFLLILVIFGGTGTAGAQRWFQVGSFSFQPSEIAKIIMVICLASFFTEKRTLNSRWDSFLLIGLVGLPFLLIFKQPDLGTALVFVAILLGMLCASWASPKLLAVLFTPIISILVRPLLPLWIIYLGAVAISLFLSRARFWDWAAIFGTNTVIGLAMPFIWGLLKPYQRQRITAFLDPGADPYGAGYHSLQSKIAIGSGGLFGKGFLHGTQTQLQFIPEQHSDFIFSAIGEEWGLIGAGLTLVLFAIVLWRTLVIASDARDYFGFLLASGIAAMTAFHILANVGMVLGILPVVGIPLPFISFGGTSLIINLISMGILQSICMRRQKLIF